MKHQRIMIDAGFTCPNRDGSVGIGGCTFCHPDAFRPAYCTGSIRQQLEAGKAFFGAKYRQMKYLAYFQSYSNTYAPLPELQRRYAEALSVPDVEGLVIATRPDCLTPELLVYLSTLRTRQGIIIEIELGVESFSDRTLQLVHRGHTVSTSIAAIRQCAAFQIPVGVHLIFGLPGEAEADILAGADILNTLPVSWVKLHQLQILRDTPIATLWQKHPEQFLALDLPHYIAIVTAFVRRLSPHIHVARYAASAPQDMLIAPRWGLKPAEVERQIRAALGSFR